MAFVIVTNVSSNHDHHSITHKPAARWLSLPKLEEPFVRTEFTVLTWLMNSNLTVLLSEYLPLPLSMNLGIVRLVLSTEGPPHKPFELMLRD